MAHKTIAAVRQLEAPHRLEKGLCPQASPHFSGILSNKRIKKTENLSEKNRNAPIDGEDRHERPERVEYWLTV